VFLMAGEGQTTGLLLGKSVASPESYAPDLLFPISRGDGRTEFSIEGDQLPFAGEDVWHAWEVSWLNAGGMPVSAVLRLRVPCDSPNLIESKSLKLYLNSLNQEVFSTNLALTERVQSDLGATVGTEITVELLSPEAKQLLPQVMPGDCIDNLDTGPYAEMPDPTQLAPIAPAAKGGDQVLHSHLLRSLCPVTGQPDWATLIVRLHGTWLDAASLLRYLLGFRRHRAFHEQCVERIYCDLLTAAGPDSLSVQALYTRRGGLDINPFRSTGEAQGPVLRSFRQ
jgi:7-cyano-7-deazaguanine reductase